MRNPTNTFMEALNKDSLFADDLVQDFRQQLEDYNVLSYYETRPISKALGLIVDQASANFGLPIDRETQIGLDRTHMEICRFDSRDSAELGISSIEQLSLIKQDNLKKFSSAVDRAATRADIEESQNIMNWLSDMNYDFRHQESIKKYQEGTGNWFRQSQQYKNWLQNDGQTLFCHGIPGGGKTILTSTVIKELHSRQDNTIGIAYLYFSYDQKHDEREPLGIFKCLLKQLCEGHVPVPDAVKSFYAKHRNRTPASIQEIVEVFQTVAKLHERNFIIIY
ncbi:hypothetical protein GGR55DRAFT_703524 [Xylaria sp. FL0064]|nr:hypothetical protein GGR55DRAFT_703524 [Xylaria sp. FL0064]